jgi:hypothetical protein
MQSISNIIHHMSAIEVAENKIKYVLIERHSPFRPPIQSGASTVNFDSKALVIVIKMTNCIKSIDDDIAVMMFLLLLAMFLLLQYMLIETVKTKSKDFVCVSIFYSTCAASIPPLQITNQTSCNNVYIHQHRATSTCMK